MSVSDRRAKLDHHHPELSIRRQCAMLGVARSGVYRRGMWPMIMISIYAPAR